jgi:hypothetical protein
MIDEQTTTATGHQLLAAWLQASGCLSSAASVANYAYPAVFLGYWLLAIRYRLFWPLFRNPRSLSFRSLVPLFPWSLLLYRRRPRRLSWGRPRPHFPVPWSLFPVPSARRRRNPTIGFFLAPLSRPTPPTPLSFRALAPRPRVLGPRPTALRFTHSLLHWFPPSPSSLLHLFSSSLIQFFTRSLLHLLPSSFGPICQACPRSVPVPAFLFPVPCSPRFYPPPHTQGPTPHVSDPTPPCLFVKL